MSGIYKDVTNDDLAAFLREAAVYFRKRPTGGEDMAFWANEANAERCEKGADTIASLTKEVERLRRERDVEHANFLVQERASQYQFERASRAEATIERLREALTFYANPETYHAIAIFGDHPCGKFSEDFSEDQVTQDSGYERPMPGKCASAALQSTEQRT